MHTKPILCTALLLGLAAVTFAAHGSVLSGHDTNAPVNYAADQIQLLDKQGRVMLSGNVDITQGDLHLRAARAVVAYTNGGSVKIQRLDASGNVEVTRTNESARGDVAVYDFNRRIITMVGGVVLHRGGDVLRGSRLVTNLDTGLSSVDGRGGSGGGHGGRVSGSFTVPKTGNSGGQ